MNYYLGGHDVIGYHLVNIFVHACASIFLFLFIYHTLNLPSFRDKYASQAYPIALLSTILWAINPLQTQAVTYIVQRMTSLAGMFYIISMYFYVKARSTEKREKCVVFLVFCFISFAMAFGSKENAALLPVSLFLYEILLVQKEPGSLSRTQRKVVAIVFVVAMLLGLIYVYLRTDGILSFLTEYEERPFSVTERLLTESRIILLYISLLLYPMPGRLSIAHSVEISTSLFDPVSTFGAILFIAGSVGVLIFVARKHPLISFSYLFFFLNHLMESSLLPLELLFEHRNYVPSMFFFLPIAIGLYHLLEMFAEQKRMKCIISAFIVFLVIILGHSTFVRNFAWKSEKTLWMDAVKKAPDGFRAHHNLGVYYQDHGFPQKAISAFEKALNSPGIQRKNEVVITYYQLGKLYDELGDCERAKFFYEEALLIHPAFSHALGNLASIYHREGDSLAADAYLMKAIEADPDDPTINSNMGLYWLRAGFPEKAMDHFMKSMKDENLRKSAFLYLGIAYKQKGWLGKAAVHFRKSASVNPQDITPHLHLAEIYHRRGHDSMSRFEAEKVVRMMTHGKSLFYQTVDLITKKGNSGDVQLCASIILPLIYKALDKRFGDLQEWKAHLKKTLAKGGAIN
ncbi:MAG: hypothetical protein PVG99_05230 [Desulfobacteraceae bacterium]